MSSPRSLKQAQNHRYDAGRNWWAATPGYPYQPDQCAEEINKYRGFSQCTRKPGYGPDKAFCKQHAQLIAKEERSE